MQSNSPGYWGSHRNDIWQTRQGSVSLWAVARYVCTIRNILYAFVFVLTLELMVINILQYSTGKCTTFTSMVGVCSMKSRSKVPSVKLNSWMTSITEPNGVCPLVPPGILEKVNVSTIVMRWKELEAIQYVLEPGGRYRPPGCTARHKVAVIIPFRDREMHLKIFLNNIHPFLQKQQLDYGIFIIELMPNVPFNRAMLMNIGFTEASLLYDYQCFVFHDVDLIPENGLNMYSCPEHPRHMSVAIDKMKYRLPYKTIFGGAVSMTKEQFVQVNGFSNKYFGWGGEDDDMFNRLRLNNMSIIRFTEDVARYKMLSHRKEKSNPDRFHLLKGVSNRWKKDGLSSLQYTRVALELRKLYTYILVDIDEVLIMTDGKYKGKDYTLG